MDAMRSRIRSFLGLGELEPLVTPVVHDQAPGDGFVRKSISYVSDGDTVQAFLFEPCGQPRAGAVVALHQHNSQWRMGKSEIAGLAGDALQAFGPALARSGVYVLAPDAVGFESRSGAARDDSVQFAPPQDPARGSTAQDWLQYYNQAMHRLVRGELLMRKVLIDVHSAVSVLSNLTQVSRVGVLGHSYGGNSALFAAALDTRIAFAVSSGAACSYRYKLLHGVGLEMALVIPGFAEQFDFDDLMRCVAPRRLFVVSAEDDPFSADAQDLVVRARPAFEQNQDSERLEHLRVPGAHALDRQRFDAIVNWVLTHSS